jgi:hypothetical protein
VDFYAAPFLALYSAQRFLVASIMRFRPAALSLRFFLGAVFAGATFGCFIAAQRFCCAALIFARVAALNFRLFRAGGALPAGAPSAAAALGGRPLRGTPIPSMDRTCCICSSILPRCASNPASAAFSTSVLKRPVCIGMYSNYAPTHDSFGLRCQKNCTLLLGYREFDLNLSNHFRGLPIEHHGTVYPLLDRVRRRLH